MINRLAPKRYVWVGFLSSAITGALVGALFWSFASRQWPVVPEITDAVLMGLEIGIRTGVLVGSIIGIFGWLTGAVAGREFELKHWVVTNSLMSAGTAIMFMKAVAGPLSLLK